MKTRFRTLVAIVSLSAASLVGTASASPYPIDLGGLTDYLFVFTDGNKDANWQGASKGYVGDVAVSATADQRTSGTVPYAGTIYTDAPALGKWQDIVDDNPGQASSSLNQTSRIAGLETDLSNAFSQANALAATAGFESRSSSSLNGLDFTLDTRKQFVIDVTSGFDVSSVINITGRADQTFLLRWDQNETVKFSGGGGINPLGGLTPANFVHVAGDINASGGGSNPSGLESYLQEIEDINGGSEVDGGGFFTGYWLTTGDSKKFETSSLSNAIFVGGWYSSTTKFSMTSGTSGVYVTPVPLPAAGWFLLSGLAALGLIGRRRRSA